MKVKVSVIIPIYNMETYLRECLDSILQQTLKEIEIICVDDGSTDGTIQILQEYGSRYFNLRVFTQDHCYAGVARNMGISYARGEYVAFMDADDYYASIDALEILYFTAKKENVFICGGGIEDFFDRTGFIMSKKYVCLPEGRLNFFDQQDILGFTRFIYSRRLLTSAKISFPSWKIVEDPFFLLNVFCIEKNYWQMKKIVYRRRVIEKKQDIIKEFCGWIRIILMIMPQKNILNKLYKNILENKIYNSINVIYLKIIEGGDLYALELLNKIWGIISDNDKAFFGWDLRNPLDIKFIRIKYNVLEYKKNEFIQKISQSTKIAVYGGGYVGKFVVNYMNIHMKKAPDCVVVSNKIGNCENINGIKVKQIEEIINEKEDYLILVATYQDKQMVIKQHLENLEFHNILLINFNEFKAYDFDLYI